ncbi:hypothetical protein CALCODRAFT_501167, partial [Calocera cornea HHB12733]
MAERPRRPKDGHAGERDGLMRCQANIIVSPVGRRYYFAGLQRRTGGPQPTAGYKTDILHRYQVAKTLPSRSRSSIDAQIMQLNTLFLALAVAATAAMFGSAAATPLPAHCIWEDGECVPYCVGHPPSFC